MTNRLTSSSRRFTPRGSGLWLGCLACAALLGRTGLAESGYKYDPNWNRSFRIGVLLGFNTKAHFNTAGSFGVSSAGPGVYDDGYVKTDNTGNAGGVTANWGYNNASQYDAAARTLAMHKTTTFAASGQGNGNDAPYVGFDLAYGSILKEYERVRLGWEFGAGILPFQITESNPMSGTISQATYQFDTGGIILPGAGYHGTAQAAGAPVISATPVGPPSISTLSGTVTGNRRLDVTLYAFKLGPTLFWDLNRHIGLQISAGPAFGLVDGELDYEETLTLSNGSKSRNKGGAGVSDLTYGAYVNGMLTYHTVRNGDFYIGMQYMPMTRANLGGGGRSAQLDLKGQVAITMGVNWPF